MPTFRNWKTKSGYGVKANLPNASHPFTYQLKPRAVEFYKELEYESGDSVDGRLVWPLRKLGDLYIGGEEEFSDDEIKELPTLGKLDKFSFTDSEKRALAQYVHDHPLSTETIKDDLNKRLFDGKFDFSSKNTSMQSELAEKDSHSLPTDVVEHIDSWVNWENHKYSQFKSPSRDNYLKSVAEIPGAVESIRDFVDHSTSIQTLSNTRGVLSYRFLLGEDTLSDWTCDDHRFDDNDMDFSVRFGLVDHPIEASSWETIHKFNIIDGYTTNWEVYSDYTGEIDVEGLTPAEWHSVIHDKSRILDAIGDFFDDFSGYELADPHQL